MHFTLSDKTIKTICNPNNSLKINNLQHVLEQIIGLNKLNSHFLKLVPLNTGIL